MSLFDPRKQRSFTVKMISVFTAFIFSFSLVLPPPIYAQSYLNVPQLPSPGAMVTASPGFTPAIIQGITIHPEDPLQFNFIVDNGDNALEGAPFEEESIKLIKYFLAALTIPEEELWVNLSPYEEGRIIPDALGATEMGRDMLAQDYMLKQLTASLMYPEKALGQKFWNRVYNRAQQMFGTTEIPVSTFNKVWIVPEKAVILEDGATAYIAESRLKVMLEEDYISLMENISDEKRGTDLLAEDDVKAISTVSSQVVKQVLIPEIEKEVNTGKNFANLRQIYHSMILASWYKEALQESLLSQVYVNQGKTKGIDIPNKEAVKKQIYDQYTEAFRQGVYDYIKEDYDPASRSFIARRYISGGFDGKDLPQTRERRRVQEVRRNPRILGTEAYSRLRTMQTAASQGIPTDTGARRRLMDVNSLAIENVDRSVPQTPVRLAAVPSVSRTLQRPNLPVMVDDEAMVASMDKDTFDRLRDDLEFTGFKKVGQEQVHFTQGKLPYWAKYALSYFESKGDADSQAKLTRLRSAIREGRLRAGPATDPDYKDGGNDGNIYVVTTDKADPASITYSIIAQFSQPGENRETQVSDFQKWYKQQRSQSIETLALYTAGAVTPTVDALRDYGVFELLDANPQGITIQQMANRIRTQTGVAQYRGKQYLHGVMRVLGSMGWVTRSGESASDNLRVTLTDKGKEAVKQLDHYNEAANVIPESIRLADYLMNRPGQPTVSIEIERAAQLAENDWNLPSDMNAELREEIRGHLDGYIAGNAMMALMEDGLFNQFNEDLTVDINAVTPDVTARQRIGNTFKLFEKAGFVTGEGSNRFKLTQKGLVAFDRTLAFGVPVSYDPSYKLARELLSGRDPRNIPRRRTDGSEALVDRPRNVQGSGASHATYFRHMEKIITESVNDKIKNGEIPPATELSSTNPFVLSFSDTGSGDGEYLKNIHKVITGRNEDGTFKTKYGELMAANPSLYKLEMVGVDFFEDSRQEARQTLAQHKVPHTVIHGDVAEPEQIVQDVKKAINDKYGKGRDVRKVVFHTRTFLDHNRPWRDIEDVRMLERRKQKGAVGTGAFGWRGVALSNAEVEQNLYEHMNRWRNALASEGQNELLLIELHTIPEQAAASNLRRSLDIAYQLSHLYSDQFIVEEPVFRSVVEESGWETVSKKTFPPRNEELTTVSINFLRAKPEAPQNRLLRSIKPTVNKLVEPIKAEIDPLVDRYWRVQRIGADRQASRDNIDHVKQLLSSYSNDQLTALGMDLRRVNDGQAYDADEEKARIKAEVQSALSSDREAFLTDMFTTNNTILTALDFQINQVVDRVNAYDHPTKGRSSDGLQVAKVGEQIQNMDQFFTSAETRSQAEQYRTETRNLILDGNYVPQELFAGSATRLNRGPMYNIDVWDLAEEQGQMQDGEGEFRFGMGPRQILAYRGSLKKLADQAGRDFNDVMANQKIIVNTNGEVHDDILKDFIENDFYGFTRENVFFVRQPTLRGYDAKGNYDPDSANLAYGHGYNLMQLNEAGEAVQLSQAGDRETLDRQLLDYFDDDMIIGTHRVNDLTKFLDDEVISVDKIAFGRYLMDQGHNVVGELVDNPTKQKGGNAVYDPSTGKTFLMETSNSKGSENLTRLLTEAGEQGAPYNAFRLMYRVGDLKQMTQQDLPYNLRFKKGTLYLEAVTGDITQLPEANAAFFTKPGTRIQDMKEVKHLPDALDHARRQDEQLRNDPFARSIADRAAQKTRLRNISQERKLEATRPAKFGTSGDRGIINKDFGLPLVRRLAQGVAQYVNQATPTKTVLIGYDTRQGNVEAARETASILAANDIKVKFVAVNATPTPVLAYMASQDDDIGGVINLTASHSPYTDGGFKFSPGHGGASDAAITDQITELANTAESYKIADYDSARAEGYIEELDRAVLVDDYVDNYLVKTMQGLRAQGSSRSAWDEIVSYARDNKDFKLVLDPMQGTGIEYMKALYDRVAEASGRTDLYEMINDREDPRFRDVNGAPQPDKDTSNGKLIDRVKQVNARGNKVLGLSLDGDSDRFGFVDTTGQFISANDTIALFTYFLKKEAGLEGDVGKTVATSNFTNAVVDHLNEIGIPTELVETPVGFKYMVEDVVKNGRKFVVAGEESAHVGVGPFMQTWDDGIAMGLTGLWMTARTGKSLLEYKTQIQQEIGKEFFIKPITVRHPTDNKLNEERKATVNAKIGRTKQELASGAAVIDTSIVKQAQSLVDATPTLAGQTVKDIITKDGVKLVFDNSDWVLMRPSGTEPAVKLYVEVTDQDRMDDLFDVGKKLMSDQAMTAVLAPQTIARPFGVDLRVQNEDKFRINVMGRGLEKLRAENVPEEQIAARINQTVARFAEPGDVVQVVEDIRADRVDYKPAEVFLIENPNGQRSWIVDANTIRRESDISSSDVQRGNSTTYREVRDIINRDGEKIAEFQTTDIRHEGVTVTGRHYETALFIGDVKVAVSGLNVNDFETGVVSISGAETGQLNVPGKLKPVSQEIIVSEDSTLEERERAERNNAEREQIIQYNDRILGNATQAYYRVTDQLTNIRRILERSPSLDTAAFSTIVDIDRTNRNPGLVQVFHDAGSQRVVIPESLVLAADTSFEVAHQFVETANESFGRMIATRQSVIFHEIANATTGIVSFTDPIFTNDQSDTALRQNELAKSFVQAAARARDEISRLSSTPNSEARIAERYRQFQVDEARILRELENTGSLSDDVLFGIEFLRGVMDRVVKPADQISVESGQNLYELIYRGINYAPSLADPLKKPVSSRKDVSISLQVERGLAVDADPILLQTAFLNLVKNANDAMEVRDVEAGEAPHQLAITVENVDNDNIEIRFSDTGSGMSEETLARLFTDDFSTKGTVGVGSGYTKNVIESHGGTIRAESPGIGQGATFVVRLPLRQLRRDEAMAALDRPGFDGKLKKGGIDLNPALLDLQIKRDGNGVPLPIPQQPIHNMKIDGFVPIIINVTPLTTLPFQISAEKDAPEGQELSRI